jgi:hypothetical protein
MKKTLKALTLAAVIALSLLASSGSAYAQDVQNGRETAWTYGPNGPDAPALPDPLGVTWELFRLFGVTWE